jgi:hypothetical protein
VGDEAALTELASADNEKLSLGVDIADAEAARLPCAQPKAVAEGEDGVIGGSPIGGPRVVGEGSRGREQPTGLGGVEEERYALLRLSPARPDKR